MSSWSVVGELEKADSKLWTTVEIDTLKTAVKRQSSATGLIIDWEKVSIAVGLVGTGRPAKECRERWEERDSPAINSLSWSTDEDIRLLQAFLNWGIGALKNVVDRFNYNQPRVRSMVQCQERLGDILKGNYSYQNVKGVLARHKPEDREEGRVFGANEDNVENAKPASIEINASKPEASGKKKASRNVGSSRNVDALRMIAETYDIGEGLCFIADAYDSEKEADEGPENSKTFTKLFNQLYAKRKIKILMLGLDAVGKSSILVKLGKVVTTISEIGFNVETVDFKNICFTGWDARGQDKIRSLWRHYFQDTQGLIFVVDSNDRDRVIEARDELHRMLNEDELRDAVLLVVANKKELPNAMNDSEIVDKLGLHSLRQCRWHIQRTCATSGEGLYEGLDWLSSNIGNKVKAALAIAKEISGGSHEQIRLLVAQGGIKPLCDQLICRDTSVVTACLGSLENILKVGEADKEKGANNGINRFAEIIDECDGLEKFLDLQTHENNQIYEKAVMILERYYGAEEDKEHNHGMQHGYIFAVTRPTIPPGG